MKRLAACAAVLFVSGCQTWGPTWSELTGVRYNDITSLTDGPVVVNLIDGASPGTAPREAIKVTPGMHKLVLSGDSSGCGRRRRADQPRSDRSRLQALHALLHQRALRGVDQHDWRPYIDYEEKIPGCQVTPKAD